MPADPWNLIWVMPAEGSAVAHRTAVVITGGDRIAARPPPADLVIAADSGLEHAQSLGLSVDVVVGDLDSVEADPLAAAEADGAAVERHPVDKNATDLELAIAAAHARGASRVVVLGGAGGRLDHLLANALLLGSDAYAAMRLEWRVGPSAVVVVRGEAAIAGEPGDLVTLLPLGGPATGVTTSGLRWALAGDTLQPGSTRGVSNELTGTEAGVAITGGVLLAIHTRAGP